jgi:hypothetical protein
MGVVDPERPVVKDSCGEFYLAATSLPHIRIARGLLAALTRIDGQPDAARRQSAQDCPRVVKQHRIAYL